MTDPVTRIEDLTRTIIMLSGSIDEQVGKIIEEIAVYRDQRDQAQWNEKQMQFQLDDRDKHISELKSSIDVFNGS